METLTELPDAAAVRIFMDETKPEVLRRRCNEQSAALRRRLDILKDASAGRPLVTVDFLAEVEKTLDGWENYQQALRHHGNGR